MSTGPDFPQPESRNLLSGRLAISPLPVLLAILLAYFLIRVQDVVVLVILAILFATIIDRPVSALERHHIPRGLSVLFVYWLLIGGLVAVAWLLAPTISREADAFRQDAPAELQDLQDTWADSNFEILSGPGVRFLDQAIQRIENPPDVATETAIGLASNVGSALIEVVTIFVIAFYYLMEKGFLRGLVVSKLPPTTQVKTNRLLDRISSQVGHWMRGQLTLCLIIGFASLIGYGLMGVPFWPILGIWAGITEAIPIVGPFIGAVPAVVMAMTDSWQLAVAAGIFALVLQLTENWILVPRVMKGAVGLSPLTVFVAILVGTEYRGVVGALLAIPIAAVVQVIVTEMLLPARETQPANRMPSWRWMRQQIEQEIAEADLPFIDDPPTLPQNNTATARPETSDKTT